MGAKPLSSLRSRLLTANSRPKNAAPTTPCETRVPSFESWPYTGKRCVVLTREKRPSSKCGEEFSSDTPKKLVARLVSGGAKSIYVEGGAVIQSLLAAGLVTDLTVSIVPVLLGEGIPLFGNAGPDMRLELVGSRVLERPGRRSRRTLANVRRRSWNAKLLPRT